MFKSVLAATAAALALVGPAHATVYLGDAEGVMLSGTPDNARYWTGPAIKAGDPIAITFTFDDSACGYLGGTCYGGNADPTRTFGRPAVATVNIGDWTHTVAGSTYQFASLSGLHLEDPDITLVFDEFSTLGQAGGGRLTWDVGLPFSMSFGFQNYDPEPIGGVPEPGAWALLLLGALGVGATLRTRRARCLTPG